MRLQVNGMSAGNAQSAFSRRQPAQVDLSSQVVQPLPLWKDAFMGKNRVSPLSLEQRCNLRLILSILLLFSYSFVEARQPGIFVSFATEEDQHTENTTSSVQQESPKYSGENSAAQSHPKKVGLTIPEHRHVFYKDNRGHTQAVKRQEKKSHPLPRAVSRTSSERKGKQTKLTESRIELRAKRDAGSELAPTDVFNSHLTQQRVPVGAHNNTTLPINPAETFANPSFSIKYTSPWELLTSSRPSTLEAPALAKLSSESDTHSTGQASSRALPNFVLTSAADQPIDSPPQKPSQTLENSLEQALRFPATVFSPLRDALPPLTPPATSTSPPPSQGRPSPKHSITGKEGQDPSEDQVPSVETASQFLGASFRWRSELAKRIKKRIRELTGQDLPGILVDNGILSLGFLQQSLRTPGSVVVREADQNKGATPAAGAADGRVTKKVVPPFDEQARKQMVCVQDWYAFSVGATMNGMRDQDEDALVVSAPLRNISNARMFSLFDGHGGQEAARRCSANASNIFGQLKSMTPAALKQACLELDERIRTYREPLVKSGSTGVIALVKAVESPADTFFDLHLANVGDSRAFLLHTKDDTYEILTRDHKPNHVEELKRIQRAGGCVRRIHKRVWRVNGFLALSRSFGDFALKNVAWKSPEEQPVTAVPGISIATARPGDYLLLGCDGVFEAQGMSWDFVARLLKESIESFGGDLAAVVNQLIDVAFALGSRDNISIILVKFNHQKLTSEVERFEIDTDGTTRELPVRVLSGQEISTKAAGVYKGEHSLHVTLFS